MDADCSAASQPPVSGALSSCTCTSLTALVSVSHPSILNPSNLSSEHASLAENDPSSGACASACVRTLRSWPPHGVRSGADDQPAVGLFARSRQLSARRLPAL